ncbi:uncharacterized protein LOC119519634 [Choloepus didactylus]|uniref:uncharacterized protein LOC119519634 n=1 Tax=Choloepus didactylus TaxID=27675 RepID=UPI00189F45C9|nr:uncharacterized protein LOC119519634 [Choloepus didactylus]
MMPCPLGLWVVCGLWRSQSPAHHPLAPSGASLVSGSPGTIGGTEAAEPRDMVLLVRAGRRLSPLLTSSREFISTETLEDGEGAEDMEKESSGLSQSAGCRIRGSCWGSELGRAGLGPILLQGTPLWASRGPAPPAPGSSRVRHGPLPSSSRESSSWTTVTKPAPANLFRWGRERASRETQKNAMWRKGEQTKPRSSVGRPAVASAGETTSFQAKAAQAGKGCLRTPSPEN